MNRDAVCVYYERPGYVRIAFGRLNIRAAVGRPIAAIRCDGEFFFADLLAADEDLKRAFIGGERR